MSATAPPRVMLRHSRFIARQTTRRNASTTEAAKDTAAKSKETASNIQSKSSQGLSRVTSSAGPALSGAAQRVSTAVGRIGGRTGRLIGFVECECELAFGPIGACLGQLRQYENSLMTSADFVGRIYCLCIFARKGAIELSSSV